MRLTHKRMCLKSSFPSRPTTRPKKKKKHFHCGNVALKFPFNLIGGGQPLFCCCAFISASTNIVFFSLYSFLRSAILPSQFNGDFCCLIPSRSRANGWKETLRFAANRSLQFASSFWRKRASEVRWRNLKILIFHLFVEMNPRMAGWMFRAESLGEHESVWAWISQQKSLLYLITPNYDPLLLCCSYIPA